MIEEAPIKQKLVLFHCKWNGVFGDFGAEPPPLSPTYLTICTLTHLTYICVSTSYSIHFGSPVSALCSKKLSMRRKTSSRQFILIKKHTWH